MPRSISGLMGALLITVVLVSDQARDLGGMFEEGPPRTGAIDLCRSAALALGAIGLVWAFRPRTQGAPPPRDLGGRCAERAGILGAATTLAAFSLGLVAGPDTLNRLVVEDGVAEWASALLWFLAAGLVVSGRPKSALRLETLAAVGIAGMYLVLGLEEISWFQRVLDIEATGRFANNAQHETNLHNFATNFTGQTFFVVAFVVGVAIPFVRGGRPTRHPIAAVIGSTGAIYLIGGASALTYELWNIAAFQLIFFASVAVVVLVALHERTTLGLAVAALMVLTQILLVVAGDRMVRTWDETEVRELLVPAGLVVAAWAARQPARTSRSPHPTPPVATVGGR